jgi:hypothetical protein
MDSHYSQDNRDTFEQIVREAKPHGKVILAYCELEKKGFSLIDQFPIRESKPDDIYSLMYTSVSSFQYIW